MAPYLLLGFFVAGLLAKFVSPDFVQRHLGKRGLRQIVNASLFGVPLPLCSCSVIPVTASLRKQGAGPGATVSFLTSTPQTGADSILVTWGMLGPFFTVVRVAVAFVSGVLVGWLVEKGGDESGTMLAEAETSCCSRGAVENRPSWGAALRHAFVTLPGDIGMSLVMGIAISALITVLVPEDFFSGWVGHGVGSLVLVMLIGLPLYVCSTGSIPIALGLLHMGFTPGAALVFLIAGPATNGATFTTIHGMLGRKATGLFLLGIGLVSLGSGWLLDQLAPHLVVAESLHEHGEEAAWWAWVTAIVLLVMIGRQIPGRIKRLSNLRQRFSTTPGADGGQSDTDDHQLKQNEHHQPECCGGRKSVGMQSDT